MLGERKFKWWFRLAQMLDKYELGGKLGFWKVPNCPPFLSLSRKHSQPSSVSADSLIARKKLSVPCLRWWFIISSGCCWFRLKAEGWLAHFEENRSSLSLWTQEWKMTRGAHPRCNVCPPLVGQVATRTGAEMCSKFRSFWSQPSRKRHHFNYTSSTKHLQVWSVVGTPMSCQWKSECLSLSLFRQVHR